MKDINVSELEIFLKAEAIKLAEQEEIEVAPITPQFNSLRNPINEIITTEPIITNEKKVTQPSVL